MPKAANRLNFTKAAIAAIPPAPPGRRTVYNDTQIRGLQLIVTERGAKSFYFYKRIGGKPYRDLLGRNVSITLRHPVDGNYSVKVSVSG